MAKVVNKPATASSPSARWYLWDGGFLAVGKSNWGVIPPHSHHAIQIVVAIDGEMAIKGARGDWRTGRGIIVRHDVEHSYDGKGALGAMIFVDPESYEGVWLQTALADDITDALEPGPDGWIDDMLAFVQPWGFDPRDVRVPVYLSYGRADTLVPAAHGDWLAAAIPDAHVVVTDAGHLGEDESVETEMAWLADR